MKKSTTLHAVRMSALLAAFVLLGSTNIRAREPQNQLQCDQAGGQWTKNQLTGEFRCEIPPSGPAGPGSPGPDPNLPANVSVALTWNGSPPDKHTSIHVALGSDIHSHLGLEFTNDGDRAAPPGFHVVLALFGQDPPIFRFNVRTIVNTPRVNAGQTVEDRNLGPVHVASPVTAGTYNFCATLANGKRDCFPMAVEVTLNPIDRSR
jgi:hypothetical protein